MNFSSLVKLDTNAGLSKIGYKNFVFDVTFAGNGFTISNLYLREIREVVRMINVELFSATSSNAKIRNIGLVRGAVYSGTVTILLGGGRSWGSGTVTIY